MATQSSTNNLAAFGSVSENFVQAATQDQGTFVTPASQTVGLRNGSVFSNYWVPQQLPTSMGTSPTPITLQLLPGSYGGLDYLSGLYVDFVVANTGTTGASCTLTPAANAFAYSNQWFSQNSLTLQYYPETAVLERYENSDYYKLLNIQGPENLNASTFLASATGITGANSSNFVTKINEPLSQGKVCVSALNSAYTIQLWQNTQADFVVYGTGAVLAITSLYLRGVGYAFVPAIKEMLLNLYQNNKVITSYIYPRQYVVPGASVTSASSQQINFGISQQSTALALKVVPRVLSSTGIAKFTPVNVIASQTYYVGGTPYNAVSTSENFLFRNNQLNPMWYPGGIYSVYGIDNIPFCMNPAENIPAGRLTGSHYINVNDSITYKATTGFSTTSLEYLIIQQQSCNLIQSGGSLSIVLL